MWFRVGLLFEGFAVLATVPIEHCAESEKNVMLQLGRSRNDSARAAVSKLEPVLQQGDEQEFVPKEVDLEAAAKIMREEQLEDAMYATKDQTMTAEESRRYQLNRMKKMFELAAMGYNASAEEGLMQVHSNMTDDAIQDAEDSCSCLPSGQISLISYREQFVVAEANLFAKVNRWHAGPSEKFTVMKWRNKQCMIGLRSRFNTYLSAEKLFGFTVANFKSSEFNRWERWTVHCLPQRHAGDPPRVVLYDGGETPCALFDFYGNLWCLHQSAFGGFQHPWLAFEVQGPPTAVRVQFCVRNVDGLPISSGGAGGSFDLQVTIFRGQTSTKSISATESHSISAEISASYGKGFWSVDASVETQFENMMTSAMEEESASTREETTTWSIDFKDEFYAYQSEIIVHLSDGTVVRRKGNMMVGPTALDTGCKDR